MELMDLLVRERLVLVINHWVGSISGEGQSLYKYNNIINFVCGSPIPTKASGNVHYCGGNQNPRAHM